MLSGVLYAIARLVVPHMADLDVNDVTTLIGRSAHNLVFDKTEFGATISCLSTRYMDLERYNMESQRNLVSEVVAG